MTPALPAVDNWSSYLTMVLELRNAERALNAARAQRTHRRRCKSCTCLKLNGSPMTYSECRLRAVLMPSARAAAPTLSLIQSPNQEVGEGSILNLDVTTLVSSLTDNATAVENLTIAATSTGTPALSFAGCNGGAYGSGCTIVGSGAFGVVTAGNAGVFNITLTVTNGEAETTTGTFTVTVLKKPTVTFSNTDASVGTSNLAVTFTSAVATGFANDDLTIAGATCTPVATSDSGVTYTSSCTADGSATTISLTLADDKDSGFVGAPAVTYSYAPTLQSISVTNSSNDALVGPNTNIATAAGIKLNYTFSGPVQGFLAASLISTAVQKDGSTPATAATIAAPVSSSANTVWLFGATLHTTAVTTTFVLNLASGTITPGLGSVTNSRDVIFDEDQPTLTVGSGPFYLDDNAVTDLALFGVANPIITAITDDVLSDNNNAFLVSVSVSGGVSGRVRATCTSATAYSTPCKLQGTDSTTPNLIPADSVGKYTLSIIVTDQAGRASDAVTADVYVRATIGSGAGSGKLTKDLNAPFNTPSGTTRTVQEIFDNVCTSSSGEANITVDVTVADVTGSQASTCTVNNDNAKQGADSKPGLTCVFTDAGKIKVTVACAEQFVEGDSNAQDVPHTYEGFWEIAEQTPPSVSAFGSFVYTENGAARTLSSDINFTIADATDANLTKIVVSRVSCPIGKKDVLGVDETRFPASINVSVSPDKCNVTLSPSTGSSAKIAVFLSALKQVTYKHSSDNPDSKAVTLHVTVTDNAGGKTPPSIGQPPAADMTYFLSASSNVTFDIIEVNDELGYRVTDNATTAASMSASTTTVHISENPADGACLLDSNGNDVIITIEDVDALTQARRRVLAAEAPNETHLNLHIVADATVPSTNFFTLVRVAGPTASATSRTNSTLVPGNEETFVYEEWKVCVAAKGATTSEGGARPSYVTLDYENQEPSRFSGMTQDSKLRIRLRGTSPAGQNARDFDIFYAIDNVAVEVPHFYHPTAGIITDGVRSGSTGIQNSRAFYRSSLSPTFTKATANLDSASGNINADQVTAEYYHGIANVSFITDVAPVDFVHGIPNAVAFPISSVAFLEGGIVPNFTLTLVGEVSKDNSSSSSVLAGSVAAESLVPGQMSSLGGLFSNNELFKFKFDANATHLAFFGTPDYAPNTTMLQTASSARTSASPRRLHFRLTATHPSDGTKTTTRNIYLDVEVRGCMDVRASYINGTTAFDGNMTTLPTAADLADYDTANHTNLNGNFNINASIPALCAFPPRKFVKGAAGSLTVPGARTETSAAALQAALAAAPTDANRESARGFVDVQVPAGATTRDVALEVAGVSEDIARAVPPPKDGAIVSADLSLKLGPCGEQFDEPVEVCVFVGTVSSDRFMTMYHASAVSCSNPSLGYADFQPTTGNSFDPATGKLCGKVNSFSIVSGISLPVPATSQLEARFFQMGGGCPSECSGRGYCRAYGKCFCFEGYGGFDCSKRRCPFGEAWAADSEVTREAAECSGRGECQVASGLCTCFPGFEGPACERMACENHCSGHGKCRYINELSNSVSWAEWDRTRIQACECDPGYFGSDCSLRYCPFGDDPQTHCGADASAKHAVTISVPVTATEAGATNYPVAPAALAAAPNQAWAIQDATLVVEFADAMANAFTTSPIHSVFGTTPLASANVASEVLSAVKGLPSFIVDSAITVTDTSASSNAKDRTVIFEMTGDANGGDAIAVTCPAQYGCPFYGCRPRFQQPHLSAIHRASTDVQVAGPFHVEPDTGAHGVAIKITVTGTTNAKTFAAEACPIVVTASVPAESACVTVLSARPVPSTARNAVKPIEVANGVAISFATADPATGSYNFYYIVGSCSATSVRRAGSAREGIECAGRGVCDRSSGLCGCFQGYQGFNCATRSIII